jgi:hypothetical protein
VLPNRKDDRIVFRIDWLGNRLFVREHNRIQTQSSLILYDITKNDYVGEVVQRKNVVNGWVENEKFIAIDDETYLDLVDANGFNQVGLFSIKKIDAPKKIITVKAETEVTDLKCYNPETKTALLEVPIESAIHRQIVVLNVETYVYRLITPADKYAAVESYSPNCAYFHISIESAMKPASYHLRSIKDPENDIKTFNKNEDLIESLKKTETGEIKFTVIKDSSGQGKNCEYELRRFQCTVILSTKF